MEKTLLTKAKIPLGIKGILAVLCLFLWPSSVAASGFSVTPMQSEVSLEKGEREASFLVSVSNNTEQVATFDVSVVDFGGLDEAGGVAFLGASNDIEKKYALASWMRLEANQLTIPPHEERPLKVMIENRENLPPGGHYGAVLFRYSGQNEENRHQVAVQQVFSSLVFVKKTDGARRALELSGWEQVGHLLLFSREIKVRFQNSGNVHVVPRGTVEIRDPRGQMVSTGVINEASALILPESFRTFPVTLLPLETAWLPGKYQLSIAYRYDGVQETTIRKETFFFLPMKAVLLFGVLGGSLFLFMGHQWKRRQRVLEKEK